MFVVNRIEEIFPYEGFHVVYFYYENPVTVNQHLDPLNKAVKVIHMRENTCSGYDLCLASFLYNFFCERRSEKARQGFNAVLCCERGNLLRRIYSQNFHAIFLERPQENSVIAAYINDKGIFLQ